MDHTRVLFAYAWNFKASVVEWIVDLSQPNTPNLVQANRRPLMGNVGIGTTFQSRRTRLDESTSEFDEETISATKIEKNTWEKQKTHTMPLFLVHIWIKHDVFLIYPHWTTAQAQWGICWGLMVTNYHYIFTVFQWKTFGAQARAGGTAWISVQNHWIVKKPSWYVPKKQKRFSQVANPSQSIHSSTRWLKILLMTVHVKLSKEVWMRNFRVTNF